MTKQALKIDVNEPLDRMMNPENLRDAVVKTKTKVDRVLSPVSSSVDSVYERTGLLVIDTLITQSVNTTVTDPTSTDFTGTFLDGAGQTFDNISYNIGGVNAGVLQWGARQDDGVIIAGAGDVRIAGDGITIYGTSDDADQESIKFMRKLTDDIDFEMQGYHYLQVDDPYTASLLHMNGVNDTFDVVDEKGILWLNDIAKISTSVYKFGSASANFGATIGSTDIHRYFVSTTDASYYPTTDASSYFLLDNNSTTESFTIDIQINFSGTSGRQALFYYGYRSTTSPYTIYKFNYAYFESNTITWIINTTHTVATFAFTPTLGTFYHLSFVKDGAAGYRVYADGVLQASSGTLYDIYYNTSSRFYYGGMNSGVSSDNEYFNGYFDEARISKGIARWTTDFAPPTAEYAPSTIDEDRLDILSTTDLSKTKLINLYSGNELSYSNIKLSGNDTSVSSYLKLISTGDILLDGYRIATLTPLQVDNDPALTTIGTLTWSTTFDTLELTQTNTTLRLGQTDHIYIKNDSGVTISAGKGVMYAGAVDATAGVLKGTPAINDGATPASYYMGIATQEIATGSYGKVNCLGLVGSLTTTDFAAGDLLYINPATTDGSLTNTVPTGANQWVFPVAICTVSATGTGAVYSRIMPIQPANATSVFTTASTDSMTPSGSYQTYCITALAEALTINNPTGAVDGQKIVIRIKDNATSRTITWGANFRNVGATMPTATTASKWVYIGAIYNSGDTKWDVVAVSTEA